MTNYSNGAQPGGGRAIYPREHLHKLRTIDLPEPFVELIEQGRAARARRLSEEELEEMGLGYAMRHL